MNINVIYENENKIEKDKRIYSQDMSEYPSFQLLLEVIMDEYSKEGQRKEKIENKAGLFISGLLLLLTVYIEIFPFEKIKVAYLESHNIVVLTIFICILSLAIILLILALYCFIKTLYTREYKRVEIDDLIVENNNKAAEDKVAFFMTNHYHKILDYNINVNSEKVNNCTKGIVTTVVSFLLLFISYIVIIFIV